MSVGLVSIITPCYNDENFIGSAIRSVLAQTYQPIEHIIVDDGSSDDSCEIIQSFGDEVRFIRQENEGACSARNLGVSKASGDYFLFLDGDDKISPNAVASLMRGKTDTACRDTLIYCRWKLLAHREGEWRPEPHDLSATPPSGEALLSWLSGWYTPIHSILWPRHVFETTGSWDERLRANQDGDIVMRALLNGAHLRHVEKGIAYYRRCNPSQTSVSNRRSRQSLQSRARVLEKILSGLDERDSLRQYRQAVGERFYGLARMAATVDSQLSTQFEERARELGVAEIPEGSFLHRVACNVLGLQRKEKIAEKLAKLGIGREARRETAADK